MASPETKLDPFAGFPSAAESCDESEDRERADFALAELLRQDPHAASAAIYDRFAPPVNRWVWRLLGADVEHNDVVQQVFVRVLRSATRLRDSTRLSAWVHAITVNTVYGELRRREVRRIFLRDKTSEQTHADFVREVEARDLLLKARSIIEKLPLRERMPFMLYYVEGHTAAEVAELCGYSVATAKRRLTRAAERFEALSVGSKNRLRVFPKLREEG
jgi:RNA polymerase sigma-70 factor (ECF subfamily)